MDKAVWGSVVILAMAAMAALAIRFGGRLLPVSRVIDRFSVGIGKIATWMVLLACLVSAGNALSRYAISASSNAWLELQWYMFAVMVLLGAAATLERNEHVRVDLFYGNVSAQTRHWIDLLGGVVFLLPMCIVMIWFTWPWFMQSYLGNEQSNNAGGLVRWPVKLVLPVGFAFVALQGLSEIIKNGAALAGYRVNEIAYEKPLQ